MSSVSEVSALTPYAAPRVEAGSSVRARLVPTLVVTVIALVEFGALTVISLGVGVYYRSMIPLYGERAVITIDDVTVVSAMERARSKENPVDVVFTGGSTCNRGIDSKLFRQQTGLSAYNFASNRLAGSAFGTGRARPTSKIIRLLGQSFSAFRPSTSWQLKAKGRLHPMIEWIPTTSNSALPWPRVLTFRFCGS